uniref:Small ribosomal subunit protein uS14c n=1 Tax=Sciadopitys verticillata TaxID=28979 RepID=G3XHJ9_SCIVE|nr:ribosomal protein S14 [Sciadopitys verticillata]AMO00765.1 ribosomal protein S14 [Sciadopitys verticillata]BAK86746.1 ribosomal protein S14 [Sciadopitys verticillata]BAW34585.1 ribosomal protein S14 [Sciadopitys verticillata]BCK60754.1 ribosomal protein S14 [Sciadopitys verticillata]
MARKSLIQREKKKQILERKYNLIRQSLKKEINEVSSLQKKRVIHRKLQSSPRNSAPTRLRKRCSKTGTPRDNYRDFGLSGYILREMAHACLLPGVTKSSW